MSIKNTTLSLFILLSVQVFSQENVENTISDKFETKISYLDSIKKTFVNNELASRVDSLWMKELTSLDLYNTITGDIEKVNIDAAVDYELPTELLKERLAAMDAKSPFNIEYNQGLENIIKSFLKNRKKSFERLMGVSEYYFPLFEEALAKQNVPLEIKYLAVVESALNPRAVSKMGATGLWQFMYHTGKQYGLEIDSYIDERSDPLKSSEAATKYMTNMYKMFGDWDLVLASYNSGPGNVSKAIRRSGGQKNYWNIRKNLPKETQGYVPAFLATMYLYEYHKEHGIVPQRATVQHFATDTIMIKQQLSFKQIGDLLDVPVAQLQLLNPSYKLNVVPFYKDQNHFLRLPQEKIAVFASNESQIYAYAEHELNKRERPFESTRALAIKDSASPSAKSSNGSKTTYYTVKRGDNLSSLADKYDVSAFQIKKRNKLKSNTIAHGKSLKIITGGNEAKLLKKESIIDTVPSQIISKNQSIVAKTAKEETTLTRGVAAKENAFTYLVQKGDNLYTIAQKYNVTIAELQEWNNISNDNLQYGALLQIASKELESKEEIAVVQERKDIEYVVQKGDKLNAIATKFGSSLADLRLWNKLADNKISIGKTLVVAKDEVAIVTEKADVSSFKTKSTVASSIKKSRAEYSVTKGDSLFRIDKKYPGESISDLKKGNDIRNEDIQPGMKLKING